MEAEADEEQESQEEQERSFTSVFNELCPYYMHIGMSYREFWYGDPAMVRFFKQQHQLDIEARSQEMWLQGLYIKEALEVVLGNAFKKKGTKAFEYMKEPIRLTPYTEKEQKERAERERKKVIAHYTRLEKQWNAKKAREMSGMK